MSRKFENECALFGPGRTYRIRHFKTKPYAIFKTNAVLISSIIGDRKIELVEQEFLHRVDFNNLETGRSGPRCGIPKSVFYPFDVSAVHFFQYVPALRVGYGGRTKRWPRCLIAFRNVRIVDGRLAIPRPPFARFPTDAQLDARDRPFQFDEAHDLFSRGKNIRP